MHTNFMGEEKVFRWNNSFRALFGVGSNYNTVLGRTNTSKSGAGFTLIELLIVIAVIGVLAGILVSLINPATQLRKARDTQRKSDLSRIQSSIEIFRADLNEYPSTLPGCGLSLTGGTPPSTYMNQVPCDPLSPPPTVYFYTTIAPFSRYFLMACLENINDKNRDCDDNSGACDRCPATGRVSYTVQNP